MSRGPLTNESSNLAIFCPYCEYNVGSSPEDRCPECGVPFDRKLLASEMRQFASQPPTRKQIFALMCVPSIWHCFLLILEVFGAGGSVHGRMSGLQFIAACPTILYAFAVAIWTAVDLERRRNIRDGVSPYWRRGPGSLTVVWFAMFMAQCLLTFVTTSIVWGVLWIIG